MEPTSDLYEDIGLIYLHLVRQDSIEAAAAIEQIHCLSGARAALRAGLIVKIFKTDFQRYHWIPDFSLYAYLLEDYPEALPLLKYTMACCSQTWMTQNMELVPVQNGSSSNARRARSTERV